MAALELVQLIGDDAGHLRSGGERGVRDDAHQAVATAAVDEPDAPPAEQRAELVCGLGIDRSITRARSAEDADPCHRARVATRCFTYSPTAFRWSSLMCKPHFVRRHSTSSPVRANSLSTR